MRLRAPRDYGWVIVAVSFVLLFGVFGTQLAFGVFVKPLIEEFGWSRAGVSGAMSLGMAVSGLLGVFMGRVADRRGPRVVVTIGTAVGVLSYALLAGMDSLWEFYLWFGVGVGIYAGCAYAPVIATVSRWFGPRGTQAIGVTLLGVVIGQMVMSPIVSQVIEVRGWRTAWAVFAVVTFACGLPAIALIGKKPPERRAQVEEPQGEGGREPAQAGGYGLSTGQAVRTAPFWMLMITGFVLAVGFYAFSAHVVPYATDVGVSATAAALILTVSSIGSIPGALLAFSIARRFGERLTLLVLVAMAAVAVFLFILAGATWSFYALAVMLGFAFAAAVPVRMGVAHTLFGLKAIGTIIGLASLAFCIGGIVGPFLAGFVFDSTGAYDLAFIIGGVLLAVGALSVGLLWRRAPAPTAGDAAEAAGDTIWRAGDGLG